MTTSFFCMNPALFAYGAVGTSAGAMPGPSIQYVDGFASGLGMQFDFTPDDAVQVGAVADEFVNGDVFETSLPPPWMIPHAGTAGAARFGHVFQEVTGPVRLDVAASHGDDRAVARASGIKPEGTTARKNIIRGLVERFLEHREQGNQIGMGDDAKAISSLLMNERDRFALGALVLKLEINQARSLLTRFEEQERKAITGAMMALKYDIPERIRVLKSLTSVGGVTAFDFSNTREGLRAAREYRTLLEVMIEILPEDDPQIDKFRRYIGILDGKILEIQAVIDRETSGVQIFKGASGVYNTEGLIGRGGLSSVYRARDPSGGIVAVKKLRPLPSDPQDAESMVRRFEREIEAAMRLDHPHITRGVDSGVAGEDYFFVMEYSAMGSLRRKTFSPGQAVRIAIQVCLALDYALKRGIVHRDVKPSNILLFDEGRVAKITDFGIAKFLEGDETPSSISDIPPGTFNYMPPESISRVPEGKEHLRDIYALGITLHEILTGHPPIDFSEAQTPSVAWYHFATQGHREPFERPDSIPAGLWQIMERLFCFDPGERFQYYHTIISKLRAIYRGLRSSEA